MGLTSLSGSQAPNAAALICLVALTVAAFVMKRKLAGGVFALLTAAFAATVVAKNVMYHKLISGPHAENSVVGHRNYAHVLSNISWAQLIVGVVLMLGAFVFGRLGWPASFVATVCIYAMVCVDDWRDAYATQDASRSVHYQMVHPWLHWAFIAWMVFTSVVTVISFTWRPKAGTRRA